MAKMQNKEKPQSANNKTVSVDSENKWILKIKDNIKTKVTINDRICVRNIFFISVYFRSDHGNSIIILS
jgi:hypothetical protein